MAAVPLQAVEVAWNTASDLPIVSNSYEPAGEPVQFQLNFAPDAGTQLTVVQHTGPAFMETRFSNLPQGGTVNLTHNGISYPFVANYFGGSGNDLVLVWANNRIFVWGDQRGLTNYSGMPAAIPSPRVIDAKTDGKTVFSMETAAGCNFAILSDGTIAMWGQPFASTLARAPFQSGSAFSFPGKTPVALATGTDHGLALCQDGSVLAWGENASGQLGNGTVQRPAGPVAVSTAPGLSALSGKKVTAIAAGQGFSVALCSDGTLCTWGTRVTGHPTIRNSLYPMVVDTTSPSSAFYQKTITGFAAGFLFVQALCSDGTIIGWGQNDSGQLGTGDRVEGLVPRVIHQGVGVSALHGRVAVELACGGDHGMARCADGALVSWGYDASGQRGTNREGDRTVPTLVLTDSTVPPSALKGKTIQRITAGTSTSLALCTDGSLASWGLNPAGGVPGSFDYPGPVDTQVIKLCSAARVVDLQQSGLGAHHLLIVAYPNDTTPPAGGDFTLATRSTLRLAGNRGVPPGWQDASPPFRYSFSINEVPMDFEWCGLADRIPLFFSFTDGTQLVRLEVRDMSGNRAELTKSFTLSTTPIESWRQTFFGFSANEGAAADGEDEDGDGVPNLAEYGFGTHPHQSDAALIPQWNLTPSSVSTFFDPPLTVAGVSYAAEWSENLTGGPGTWQFMANSGSGGSHAFSLDTGGMSRVFVRLRVTRP